MSLSNIFSFHNILLQTIYSFLFRLTPTISCATYNLVFEFLCHPEMGVWAILPGHMLFKLENRVIIMPFFYGTVMALFLFSTIIYFNAQRGRKENFYVSNHLFTREANNGSSDHAGKEQQHNLHDSGHLLPPAGSGREQRNRILFLLFQFISGGSPDEKQV